MLKNIYSSLHVNTLLFPTKPKLTLTHTLLKAFPVLPLSRGQYFLKIALKNSWSDIYTSAI